MAPPPEDFPTPYYFPLPIGGISDHIDFIPSLLFIACYLAPFVLAIRKAFTSGKRTVATINSTLLPIERMVVLSFRVIMSRNNTVGEDSRKNWSMVEYTQASTGVATLALLDEVSWLLHSLCLFATRENVPYDEWRQLGGDQGRPRAQERKEIRSTKLWFSCTLVLATSIQWTVPTLFTLAATTRGAIIWLTALRFLGHAIGAGYALSLALSCIRAEREIPSLKIELARTFRRQSMMIFSVLIYRCIASFASTNDLTHPTNDPLAIISRVFFYLTQLPLELAICWDHARTDYRTVVDAGARGDGPREELENPKKAKKRRTTPLKDIILSRILRFKRKHTSPISDSASDVIPLMRTETPTWSQTSTLVSGDAGDVEKQSILSSPSPISESNPVGITSTAANSTYHIRKQETEQQSPILHPLLVEDIHVWKPRRSIWDLGSVWSMITTNLSGMYGLFCFIISSRLAFKLVS